MEYLVATTTRVPDGTTEEAIDDIRTREDAHSRELASQGHLLRLWRPPLQPGEWVAREGAGGVVSRPGLFGQLGRAARVTVVSAPPGSGKTVLLRSWISEAALAERAAWVPVSAWKRDSPRARARAWIQLNRITTEDERYRILAAAALARREALETARRTHRMDWAFWAAACDAGAAVAAGARIGRHYDTLLAPFVAAVPGLARPPAPAAPQPPPLTTRPTRPRAPSRRHLSHDGTRGANRPSG